MLFLVAESLSVGSSISGSLVHKACINCFFATCGIDLSQSLHGIDVNLSLWFISSIYFPKQETK